MTGQTMSILAGDPLTRLAFSVHQNKRVFAVLLGSGLSRAAGIPTGWEITLDLIRRVAAAEGHPVPADPEEWYRQRTEKEPGYSDLLDALTATPAERRAILHGYIEPTEQDREEGRRLPTAAHRAVADLVRRGYIRVILTTNFDRLMEAALQAVGVAPTVIAAPDHLLGAVPLIHSPCTVVKLHGDYQDVRSLNTEAELSTYPTAYNTLLDRIFDEHGLIACGWSGEWDIALHDALMRAPNRRYPLFWAAMGQPGARAANLIRHRSGEVIGIASADRFFDDLSHRVASLEDSQRPDPLSTALMVATAKRFLAKPEDRIRLDDLFADETAWVLEKMGAADLSPDRPWDQAEFRTRVKRYEAMTEGLACMAGILGRWGDDSEKSTVFNVIQSLYADGEKSRSGLLIYLGLRTYPSVLVLMMYGLGLTQAERWPALLSLMNNVLNRDEFQTVRIVDALFSINWKGTRNNAWQQIEGMDQHYAPLSDYFNDLLAGWSKQCAGLKPDFELLLGRFEVLGALAFLGRESKTAVSQALNHNAHSGWIRMPIGRAGWNTRLFTRLELELKDLGFRSSLLSAGFAQGDAEFLDLFIENHKRLARQMRW